MTTPIASSSTTRGSIFCPRCTNFIAGLIGLTAIGWSVADAEASQFQFPVQLNNWSNYEDVIDDPVLPILLNNWSNYEDVVDDPVLPDAGQGSARALSASSGFDIVIVPGSALAANQDALDAFNRAATQWKRYIKDPITVTVNADLAPLGAGILGSTIPFFLRAGFDAAVNNIRNDAASEPGDGIVASLPGASTFTAFVPTGFGISGNIRSAKSLLKAAGFTGLDGQFGASDGSITFSTNFPFDFDNSDGVSLGAFDFETVAAHEIGHLLGFTSAVDIVDSGLNSGQTFPIPTNPFDLFRFQDDLPGSDPATPAEFGVNAREFRPGQVAIFDDTETEVMVSTGLTQGDGRQASHWKANELTGTLLGLMDPTLGFGEKATVTLKDLRALDLLGWDIELLAGDLSGDGFVGIEDLNIVLGNWNQTVTPGSLIEGDPSMDGFVGIEDLNVVLGNWNAGTPPSVSVIPEPTSAALAGLLATWMLANGRFGCRRRTNVLTAIA